MTLRTIDITYRRRDYRLAEPDRDRSSIRPMEWIATSCSACDYYIRQYSVYVQMPNRNLHLACAIRTGALALVPHDPTRCQSTRAGVACGQCLEIVEGGR